MKHKTLFSLSAFMLAGLVGFAQAPSTKLLEKVDKKGDEIVIPYSKYKLPNGLTLLVHEDHSDPVVHVDVTYHVGSSREDIGKSGFAHFFEHMMFQGSDNVADEEHFKIVTEAGGTLNGTTNTDRTNYFETVPSNQLEIMLWLEADRMGYFLDAVTQEKFEVQRATVKNERGQNYDNRPYGLVSEKLGEALYPYGHGYSWTTIGYIEDLNRANLDDLKKFFLRWYGPNNATLTVAGDVDTKNVVKLVEKYFGPIPSGPEVKNPEKPKVTVDKDRYISYEDKVRFPLLYMAFPTVPNYHPDEAPLDVLSDIIGGGKNSIFYQNFVKSQKARFASVSHPCSELSGQFDVVVSPFPGTSLKDMEALARTSLAEFEKRGVTDEDIQKFVASHESQVINGLASVSGKASQLASYQTFTGNPNYIAKDLERYKKVTKEDVMRVYNEYIKGKSCVILSVVLEGQKELRAGEDNFQRPTSGNAKDHSAEYAKLEYHKGKDNFDRSKRPSPGPNPVVKVPNYWTEQFENGMRVIGTDNNEIPVVSLQLSIPAGHRSESPEKAGISNMLATMMSEGTTSHSAEEISDKLDMLGSSIRISSDDEYITVNISALKKNLNEVLELANDMLFHPKFDQGDFDREKKQALENIKSRGTSAVRIANDVYDKLLYQNGIMSIPASGTEASVESITLDDVKAFYNKSIAPEHAMAVVVGDIDREAILSQLKFLRDMQPKGTSLPKESVIASIDKTRIYLVDKQDAPQSEIRIGYLAMPYDATGERYRSFIMTYPLGVAFNSRINLNLREDKGYTYGARGYFGGSRYIGPFTASAGVRGDATAASVKEFMKEISNYADNGITPEELQFTKMSIGQSDARNYETPGQKANFLRKMLEYNLQANFVQQQTDILAKITKPEIDALAKKHLPYQNMVIVVVGDKKSNLEGLKQLGYEVVEVDIDGKPVTQ
ncbi:MAG: insulinase family protein [Flavobacteriales bacterium]|nr:insulinase family protein [Flavobacteriales bacterium]MCB9449740.1 insulinase family protein [Flavobacteriales bacterium]